MFIEHSWVHNLFTVISCQSSLFFKHIRTISVCCIEARWLCPILQACRPACDWLPELTPEWPAIVHVVINKPWQSLWILWILSAECGMHITYATLFIFNLCHALFVFAFLTFLIMQTLLHAPRKSEVIKKDQCCRMQKLSCPHMYVTRQKNWERLWYKIPSTSYI